METLLTGRQAKPFVKYVLLADRVEALQRLFATNADGMKCSPLSISHIRLLNETRQLSQEMAEIVAEEEPAGVKSYGQA